MTEMRWVVSGPKGAQLLGLVPSFLDADDPRPAAEQINERYAHGGGWSPIPGVRVDGSQLTFPGDPPLRPVAWTILPKTAEFLMLYEHGLLAIIQPGSDEYEVARLD